MRYIALLMSLFLYLLLPLKDAFAQSRSLNRAAVDSAFNRMSSTDEAYRSSALALIGALNEVHDYSTPDRFRNADYIYSKTPAGELINNVKNLKGVQSISCKDGIVVVIFGSNKVVKIPISEIPTKNDSVFTYVGSAANMREEIGFGKRFRRTKETFCKRDSNRQAQLVERLKDVVSRSTNAPSAISEDDSEILK